ncbi:MAG: hypothetical protein ACTSXD_07085 [Candidatus Heimdallarchaeaceae archaeon]
MKENRLEDCEENPDGSVSCKIGIKKRRGIFSTGSDFEIIPDPNTCKARIVGRVMESDRDLAERKRKEVEDRCKQGF